MKIFRGRPSALMWGKNEKSSCGMETTHLARPTQIDEFLGVDIVDL